MSKPFSLIKFVKDRPGHDFRYSIDSSKMNNLMGNAFPYMNIDEGLDETIRWYNEHIQAS